MDLRKAIDGIREGVTVARVFGEPIERDGTTMIPAAMVIGGGGGGGSEQATGEVPPGSGAGYGVFARPVGAFEIRDGAVRWQPATDRTWMVVAIIPAVLALIRYLLSLRD